jgi:hypothetical protein
MSQNHGLYQRITTLLTKNPWGILLAYISIFGFVYVLIWTIIEPLGIIDNFKPSVAQHRTLIYLFFVSFFSSHLLIIFIFLNNFSNINQEPISIEKNKYLERIGFSHLDTLILNCWNTSEQPNPNEPVLKKEDDGIMGEFLSISGYSNFALDYHVKIISRTAKIIEYIVFPKKDHVLYLNVDVISSDGSKAKNCWVNLSITESQIRPHGDGKHEWVFPITPVSNSGDWLKYKINIEESVRNTFGKEGWKYKKLVRLRTRGNSQIKSISIL